jgi:ribulose-phosphate 3-epimerase
MPPMKLAPSLLSGDFAFLANECRLMISYGADYLHMDVMDGHFVPNITIGAPVIQSLRKHIPNAFLDCHMMVSNPEQWVNDFAKAGASIYTFHAEATSDVNACINLIRDTGMMVGLAIKPSTPLQVILPYLELVDMVLVMTVEPGFGGQKFIESAMEKVTAIRLKYPNLDIQVDGGINLETLIISARAGANIFVAGSFIFRSESPQATMYSMRQALENL